MKSINNYISEALIKKDTKIKTPIINQLGYDESILNVEIKDMSHIKNVLLEYFEPYRNTHINILYTPKVINKKYLSCRSTKYECQDIVEIDFCRVGEGPIKKLYVALVGSKIYMQLYVKNLGTKNLFHECSIVGIYPINLHIEDNLLNWLNKIKDLTIKNKIGGEINLIKLFFGNINNIQEALITKDTKIKTHITKKDVREFLNKYLSKASSGHIKLLQKEESQWYNPSEIDQKIYELDSNKSPIKDLMEYTAKKLNITFDELWDICNHSSFVFRAIISNQNPQR